MSQKSLSITFDLDIGDWSGDGHGHSKTFQVQASGVDHIDDVRRIYLEARDGAVVRFESIGVSEGICSAYGCRRVTADQLEYLGVRLDSIGVVGKDFELWNERDASEGLGLHPSGLARLWAAWMSLQSPTGVSFAVLPETKRPRLHFYGYRDLRGQGNEHVSFFGYGLFQ